MAWRIPERFSTGTDCEMTRKYNKPEPTRSNATDDESAVGNGALLMPLLPAWKVHGYDEYAAIEITNR